ncbi:MAG: hypothetical protein ACP5G1_04645, partial [Nanopusillaceae archaeon]
DKIKLIEIEDIQNLLDKCNNDFKKLVDYLYAKTVKEVKELLDFEDIEEIYFSNIRGLNILMNAVYEIAKKIYVREIFKNILSGKEVKLYVISTSTASPGNDNKYDIYFLNQEVYVNPFINPKIDNGKLLTSRIFKNKISDDKARKISYINNYILDKMYVPYVLSIGYLLLYIFYFADDSNNNRLSSKEDVTNIYKSYISLYDGVDISEIDEYIYDIDLLTAFTIGRMNDLDPIVKEIVSKHMNNNETLRLSCKIEEDYYTIDFNEINELKDYMDKLSRDKLYYSYALFFQTELSQIPQYINISNINEKVNENNKKFNYNKDLKLRNVFAHRGIIFALFDIKPVKEDNKCILEFTINRENYNKLLKYIKNGELHIYYFGNKNKDNENEQKSSKT